LILYNKTEQDLNKGLIWITDKCTWPDYLTCLFFTFPPVITFQLTHWQCFHFDSKSNIKFQPDLSWYDSKASILFCNLLFLLFDVLFWNYCTSKFSTRQNFSKNYSMAIYLMSCWPSFFSYKTSKWGWKIKTSKLNHLDIYADVLVWLDINETTVCCNKTLRSMVELIG
jgi:hypothetical protein